MITNVYIGNIATAGGTADAITASYVPAPTVLADKMLLYFRATAANATTTPSFSPNGLTAHTIVKQGGQALAAGDIPAAGAVMEVCYDEGNTRWELINPATASIGYKVYTALLTQSGTNAPTATVLKNTLGGTPTFNYIGVGQYEIVLLGAFPAGKVVLFPTSVAGITLLVRQSDNACFLQTIAQDGVTLELANMNGLLNNNSVEIRVYP